MDWTPPTPILLVTGQGVADRLGLSAELGKKLIASGALGQVHSLDETGRAIAASREALEEMHARPLLNPSDPGLPRAVVVKASSPMPDDSGDRWMGWHASMPDHVAEQATRMWWPVAQPEGLIGALLVVSVSTCIVRVRRIEDFVRGYGRVAFSTSEPARSAEDANVYRAARIRTRPGGVTERVGDPVR